MGNVSISFLDYDLHGQRTKTSSCLTAAPTPSFVMCAAAPGLVYVRLCLPPFCFISRYSPPFRKYIYCWRHSSSFFAVQESPPPPSPVPLCEPIRLIASCNFQFCCVSTLCVEIVRSSLFSSFSFVSVGRDRRSRQRSGSSSFLLFLWV